MIDSKNYTTFINECLSNIKKQISGFEEDWKPEKDEINPLFACFHASSRPIRMEIRTEVLMPKIAYIFFTVHLPHFFYYFVPAILGSEDNFSLNRAIPL